MGDLARDFVVQRLNGCSYKFLDSSDAYIHYQQWTYESAEYKELAMTGPFKRWTKGINFKTLNFPIGTYKYTVMRGNESYYKIRFPWISIKHNDGCW